MPVRFDVHDGIAVIEVDAPPVNALSKPVREGLMDAFGRLEGLHGAVLCGAGRAFVGGADVAEWGRPPEPPFLPDVVAAIEGAPCPTVAAIHGAALGGGLELALACDARVAGPRAKLGLPEVGLGVIPGAGGTQRLPRLIGLRAAAERITAGAVMGAAEAERIGLVDAVEDDPRAAAMARVAGTARRRLSEAPAPAAEDLSDLRAVLERRARGAVAPLAALDAVGDAARLSFADGMAAERERFLALLDTPQRAALVHAFFAERAAAKAPGGDARAVTSAGVVGGGTMGSGIATALLLAGLPVTLVERDAAACDRARATVEGNLAAAAERGKLRDPATIDRFATATEHAALGDADLIVEAVFEDMDVKREVFAALDGAAKPGAVLATNTSYLDPDAIGAATARPGDVIGLHFFSPAHVMKLLEIVPTQATAADVTATAFALAKRLGKQPVLAGICDGFVGNRVLRAYRGAADRMVLDGVSPYAVDRAMEGFGFAMGPFAVYDLAGLDISAANRARAAHHPDDRPPVHADALIAAGRLGRKAGAGYYAYADGRAQDEAATRIVREATGAAPRDMPPEEIADRCLLAMANEGARIVAEGVARRPGDVDVAMLHGYGFPRVHGGPLFWARARGLERTRDDLARLASGDPWFWAPAPALTDGTLG